MANGQDDIRQISPGLAGAKESLGGIKLNPSTGQPVASIPGMLLRFLLGRQQQQGVNQQQQLENKLAIQQAQRQAQQAEQQNQQRLFQQRQAQLGVAPRRIQVPPGVQLRTQRGEVVSTPGGAGFIPPRQDDILAAGTREGVQEAAKQDALFSGNKEVAARALAVSQQFEQLPTVIANVRSMDSLLINSLKGRLASRIALDQSLINLFNKIQDPGSVVRESEFARTGASAATINRFVGAIEKIGLGGVALTNQDRKDLVTAAKIIADERGKLFNESIGRFRDMAPVFGVPEDVSVRMFKPHKPFFEFAPSMPIMTVAEAKVAGAVEIDESTNEAFDAKGNVIGVIG